jgi:hypothetical protein
MAPPWLGGPSHRASVGRVTVIGGSPWLSYEYAREESPIQRTAVLSDYPGVRSARRICSGSCDYFTPVYQSGRKIAGVGTCENLHCGSPVRVGIVCLWAKESLTSEPLLARMEAR